MKHFIIGLLAVLAFTACGPWGDQVVGTGEVIRKPLTVPAFNGIEVDGSLNVVVREGDLQRVEVEGQHALVDLIELDVRKGIWEIGTSKGYTTDRPFTVFITVPVLDHIAILGSGSVDAENVFGAGKTVLSNKGSGDLEATNVNEQRLITYLLGSGNVDITGTAANFDGQVQGSGNIEALGLSSGTANVVIQGSGDIALTAIEQLSATVEGSGNVRYRGKPRVSSRILGSGTVVPAE
jgi:hypothetical protein